MAGVLDGRTILVVEDDYFAALDLQRMIEERAGQVAGPVGRLDQARELAQADALDAAILDVKLNGDLSLPLADDLVARGIPVVLASGYDAGVLPERFADTPRLPKPYSDAEFDRLARGLFATSAGQ